MDLLAQVYLEVQAEGCLAQPNPVHFSHCINVTVPKELAVSLPALPLCHCNCTFKAPAVTQQVALLALETPQPMLWGWRDDMWADWWESPRVCPRGLSGLRSGVNREKNLLGPGRQRAEAVK